MLLICPTERNITRTTRLANATASQRGHATTIGRRQARAIATAIEAGHQGIVAGIQPRQAEHVAMRQPVAGPQRLGRGIQPIVLRNDVAPGIEQVNKHCHVRRDRTSHQVSWRSWPASPAFNGAKPVSWMAGGSPKGTITGDQATDGDWGKP